MWRHTVCYTHAVTDIMKQNATFNWQLIDTKKQTLYLSHE
jgi:hypothetical protein